MTDKIFEESEIVEALDDDAFDESISDHEGLEATKQAASEGMDFHVQMTGYRLSEFEDAVVEAAARTLIGRKPHDALARRIEERCVELTTEAVDAHLKGITAEFLDIPMIPDVGKSKDPVTLREYIGLCGREYLTQHVNRDGKPTSPSPYGGSVTRMQHLIGSILDTRFDKLVREEVSKISAEVRREAEAKIRRLADEEREKIRAAFEKQITQPARA